MMGKVNRKELVGRLKEELRQRLVEIDVIEALRRVIELLDDSEHHEKPIRQEKTKKIKKVVSKKKTKKVPRQQNKSGSEYKGVQRFVNKTTGAVTFNAQYWDGANKKTIGLGRFDNELEAAAAVQRVLGNKEEADRLFTAEVQSKITPSIKSIETYFRCKHCDLETKTKPVQCMQCNSASFDGPLKRKIPGL